MFSSVIGWASAELPVPWRCTLEDTDAQRVGRWWRVWVNYLILKRGARKKNYNWKMLLLDLLRKLGKPLSNLAWCFYSWGFCPDTAHQDKPWLHCHNALYVTSPLCVTSAALQTLLVCHKMLLQCHGVLPVCIFVSTVMHTTVCNKARWVSSYPCDEVGNFLFPGPLCALLVWPCAGGILWIVL